MPQWHRIRLDPVIRQPSERLSCRHKRPRFNEIRPEAICVPGSKQVELHAGQGARTLQGLRTVATTNYRLVRTAGVSQRGPTARRGMVPLSGLMIIVGVLMLGSALAIPASRTMQEAEMRDRIASFAESEHFESSASGSPPNTSDEDPGDDSTGSVPAIAEPEDDIEEAEEDVDVSRSTDVATTVDDFRDERNSPSPDESDSSDEEPSDPEPEQVEMPGPTHLRIPGVGIDTEIVEVGYEVVEIDGHKVREWEVASYAAGHHKTSANPGEGGNIVVTGHNDWEGEVFRTLENVEAGQEVFLETEGAEHEYVIEEIHMRREVGVSMEERLATGQFMSDMPEERVTLITCWPYGVNDHRVIVVAKPAD